MIRSCFFYLDCLSLPPGTPWSAHWKFSPSAQTWFNTNLPYFLLGRIQELATVIVCLSTSPRMPPHGSAWHELCSSVTRSTSGSYLYVLQRPTEGPQSMRRTDLDSEEQKEGRIGKTLRGEERAYQRESLRARL